MAFSGTDARAGPQVDLSLILLDCIEDPNDDSMVISRLLTEITSEKGKIAKVTSKSFYRYQISGAVGATLKLYDSIDAEKLLNATNQENPRAKEIKAAAAELNDLQTHDCIIADEMGFGKTCQSLLAAFLHSVLYDVRNTDDKVLYGPILIITPATVIVQWLREIRNDWPYFQCLISYDDHEMRDCFDLGSLSYTNMTEFPSLDTVPEELRYVFRGDDRRALSTLIVSSHETHKKRNGTKMTKNIPGVPYNPPRRKKKGKVIWKKQPRTIHTGSQIKPICIHC